MELNKKNKFYQFTISILLVVITSAVTYFFGQFIGYKIVALILLFIVSILAMVFDILPVLVTAVLSAIIWNFFFIPPTFTFHIGNPEDVLMFLMYFVIASINAVLTYKIRQTEKRARDKEEKEKTIRLYNTLLNSLSHELRTPISTIIGAIDTISISDEKLTPATVAELHSEIRIASFRLNRQVENLLSISRLESGFLKPKLDWCDVNELIFSLLEECKEESEKHRIQFEADELLPIFKIDRGFTEQIVRNILYNSLHHTPENTLIVIEVKQQEEFCQISIKDNGNGFPESELPKVFDKFYRLNNTNSGGLGLGLSIVKGFTEALNGRITVENSKSGGAQFTILLPAEATFINELKNE